MMTPAPSPIQRFLRRALVFAWMPIAVIALWAIVSSSGLVPRIYLPPPVEVLEVLYLGVTSGDLLRASGLTLMRMTLGWVLASIIAIALAAAISYDRRVAALVTPTLELMRPVPASALLPIAILAFGINAQAIIFVIAIGSVWPLLLNAISGFRSIEPRLREVSQTVGLTSWQFMFKIALPSALPDILAGLRLGLTLALILCIVGEMVTMTGGLGAEILMASRNFRSAELFAGIIAIGVIGYAINTAIVAVEDSALRWKRQA